MMVFRQNICENSLYRRLTLAIAFIIMLAVISAANYLVVLRTLPGLSDIPEQTLMLFSLIAGLVFTLIFVTASIFLLNFSGVFNYVNELKNFKEFTGTLYNTSSEIELYDTFHKFIRSIPYIDYSNLYYISESSSGELYWYKLEDDEKPLCKISSEDCLAIKCQQQNHVQSVKGAMPCQCQLSNYKKGSFICLPIAVSGNTQSILQLYNTHENFFDSKIVSKINSYIDIVKPVINNKRALHILSRKASTDKLTKLYNRSFLDSYLDNQIEAANYTKQQISIIYIDIDHYKMINDTYGHDVGDHVLVIFSELLLKCVRKTDLAARYGGDEFIVVLPFTNTDTAITIAERIRQTLSDTRIPTINGTNVPPMSCSLGISTYPDLCSNKGNLLKSSDMALYQAKQSGRNCTKVYNAELLPNL